MVSSSFDYRRCFVEVFKFCTESYAVAQFQKLCGVEYLANDIKSQEMCSNDGELTSSNNNHACTRHRSCINNGVNSLPVNFNVSHSDEILIHSPKKFLYSSDSSVYIRNKLLYYLFWFGTSLGNEIFYITFFPICIWNFDVYCVSRACFFWCLYMYVGQVAKEIFKLPRPASPPVVRMEKHLDQEYGLPSTHAMAGTGIPFTMLLLISNKYEVFFNNS